MNKAVMCGWVVALVACGGGDDREPQVPAMPQVLTRTEAADATSCPLGGTVVLAGADRDDDGALDAAEVTTRTAVCNPTVEPMPAVLVRLVAEPRGAACAEGGTAVQAGPDRNGNGVLDAEEIDHVDYVCGRALVTRIVAEPEGANCAAGGVAFQIGIDGDGDGALGDAEVAQTEYECGDAVTRNVTIAAKSELAALAHIRTVHGSVTISSPSETGDEAFDEVALPELKVVRDGLTIHDVKFLERLSLPGLELAGGLQISDNSLLTTVELPVLLTVANDFDLSRNPVLAALVGPKNVRGNVFIRDNAAMASAVLPFNIAGRLEITGNTGMTTMSVLLSDQTRHVLIAGNGLTQVVLAAHGSGALSDVEILANPALLRVSVVAKRPASLRIADNANLDSVSVTAEQLTGDVVITNPRVDRVALRSSGGNVSLAVAGALAITGPISSLESVGLDVGGDLTLEATQLHDLAPIRSVGGSLRIRNNGGLTRSNSTFPVGGGLEVVGNAVLDSAFFFQQDTINGDVLIADNPALASVQALLLTHTVHGSVAIRNNAAMVSTLAGPAQIDGALEVTGNASLTGLGFETLAQVGGAVTISNNAALPAIALAALAVTGDVHIEDNAALGHLSLPALLLADSMAVRHNHALPACEVTAVFAHVRSPSLEQLDNDATGSCGP